MGVLTALAVVAQEATIPSDSVSTMRNVELDELVVKESLVKHSTKSDTYKVTETMRRGLTARCNCSDDCQGLTTTS